MPAVLYNLYYVSIILLFSLVDSYSWNCRLDLTMSRSSGIYNRFILKAHSKHYADHYYYNPHLQYLQNTYQSRAALLYLNQYLRSVDFSLHMKIYRYQYQDQDARAISQYYKAFSFSASILMEPINNITCRLQYSSPSFRHKVLANHLKPQFAHYFLDKKMLDYILKIQLTFSHFDFIKLSTSYIYAFHNRQIFQCHLDSKKFNLFKLNVQFHIYAHKFLTLHTTLLPSHTIDIHVIQAFLDYLDKESKLLLGFSFSSQSSSCSLSIFYNPFSLHPTFTATFLLNKAL